MHSYVSHYQGVNLHFPTVFPMLFPFSYGFPMVSPMVCLAVSSSRHLFRLDRQVVLPPAAGRQDVAQGLLDLVEAWAAASTGRRKSIGTLESFGEVGGLA